MTVNKKAPKSTAAVPHLNHMAGHSWDITNPLIRLQIAASSCFFGEPKYYDEERGKKGTKTVTIPASAYGRDSAYLSSTLGVGFIADSTSSQRAMESAIDAALAYDVEGTLAVAANLRNADHIRVTPQVILVRAANHPKARGTGLVRTFAKQIIKRADEPATCIAYQLSAYGANKPIPNALKRALKDALESFDEYSLAKYRNESRTVKTVDVVNLVHPKSVAVNKLVRGELKTTDQTWESIISAEGSTKQSWSKALDVMGHMAMIRNVRNLLQKGVEPQLFLKKLVYGASTGKQLPFRYVSAYNAIREIAPGGVQDAIDECLSRSMGNLPKFKGRVMSLCDNSGSARGATTSSMGTMQVSMIANLTGILTGMQADDGYVGVFGDRLTVMGVRKHASVFDQLQKADKYGEQVGGGTENGIWLFWDKAIREKEQWDHVFIYSDQQAGHGGLYGTNQRDYARYSWPRDPRFIDVPKLVADYRRTVNPGVNVYLVQVAGYQDTIMPEFYDRTYILGGWSDGLLKFAAKMAEMRDGK